MDSTEKTFLAIVAALFALIYLSLTDTPKYDDTRFDLRYFGLKGPVQEVVVTQMDSLSGTSTTGKLVTDSMYRPLALQGNYTDWFFTKTWKDSFLTVNFYYPDLLSPLDSLTVNEWVHGNYFPFTWTLSYKRSPEDRSFITSETEKSYLDRSKQLITTEYRSWDPVRQIITIKQKYGGGGIYPTHKIQYVKGVPETDSIFNLGTLNTVILSRWDEYGNCIRRESRELSKTVNKVFLLIKETNSNGDFNYIESSSWDTDGKNWEKPADTNQIRTRRSWYFYEYDSRGNWIRQEKRSTSDGKAEVVTTRKITYDPKAKQ